jgi:hypothetical protein
MTMVNVSFWDVTHRLTEVCWHFRIRWLTTGAKLLDWPTFLFWKWRQCVLSRHQQMFTRLQRVTFQKTLFFIWLKFKRNLCVLSGLGTSLVLTQAEIVLHCHYPRGSIKSGPPLIIPQLGSALAYFSMPLLLLGIISLYGSQEALLLQAGVVLQGFLGAVILSPLAQRPSPISRYHSRPRAFTFVVSDEMPTARRDVYLNDRWAFTNFISEQDLCSHTILPHLTW